MPFHNLLSGLRGQGDKLTHEWVVKQLPADAPVEWQSQVKVGGHYITASPGITPTKVKTIELAAVLQTKHNLTHDPKDHIHIFDGNETENAYAKASWVVKDEAARSAELERQVDDDNADSNKNGWKLAKRSELGFIDKNTQWAKNKVTRPFIVPPTEVEVYLSDSDSEKGS